LSELVVFFLRRIFTLLRPGGFTAFITTNSIKDGDIRKDGLEQVVAQGGSIIFANRGMKWPGGANLFVSLVSCCRGPCAAPRYLDGHSVNHINTLLEADEHHANPLPLATNREKIFMGTIWLGDGFVIEGKDKLQGISTCERERFLRPLCNGEDLNNNPSQECTRRIIFLQDYDTEDHASEAAPALLEHLRHTVLPERLKQKNEAAKKTWWLYYRYNNLCYDRLASEGSAFCAARTTKHLSFSLVAAGRVFTDAVYVFPSTRWEQLAVLQSSLHESKYCIRVA
jgi:hypothetical protein